MCVALLSILPCHFKLIFLVAQHGASVLFYSMLTSKFYFLEAIACFDSLAAEQAIACFKHARDEQSTVVQDRFNIEKVQQ